MIVWRRGLGGYIGAAKTWIKGVFEFRHTVTTEIITPPEIGFGVYAFIDPKGQGVIGSMSDTGQGVYGEITDKIGVLAIINDTGAGVSGSINESGKGVSGKL